MSYIVIYGIKYNILTIREGVNIVFTNIINL